MNELNLNKPSTNEGEKRPFSFKLILLNIVVFFVPILLVVTLVLTSIFVSRDGYYFAQIDKFRNIWHNSANNVTEIKQENPDFSGWINSDVENFDFPIFNSGYKNCSFYIDENCNPENSQNLILHTPEKINKELNASVLAFKDVNFFNRHPSLDINTDYDKGTYVVFASYYANSTDFDTYNFHTLDEKALAESLEKLVKLSFLNPDVNVKNDDDFLTIIQKEKDEEFVVLARKLRKGEEIVFSSGKTKK